MIAKTSVCVFFTKQFKAEVNYMLFKIQCCVEVSK